MREGFGQTDSVLKRLQIQTAEGVVPITVIHLLYDVIIDHIALRCDLQSYCNVNKMCFPRRDYTRFFLARRLFSGLSFCVHSPQEKKGISENEAETGKGGGLALTSSCLRFALPEIMFFQILIGLRVPWGGARRDILALRTRSVLTPFAVIISFFLLDSIREFSIEFANLIICWGTELLEIVRRVKGRNPLLCRLANSLVLAIPTST